jgi:eukaryotic-like serine/threonine-protein kinase
MVGKTVSHYKILEKLGEGGMGVVYKAEDLNLTRTVALKFLPHGLEAHERERARFLQEARAAAILNHPNICTIHDIQDHDGQLYIVMEYVQGRTLRETVPVRKIQDAITYAIQIAEAIEEAHTHGIVHRDIKVENIMVNSKNQVKVMDFGLAKLKGSLKLTRTGYKVGTLSYMAPEQIRGEPEDARSDIFSFGIVLHEMLTGHLPFRGEHEAAMVYSIMNEEPEPLQRLLPGAPSELLHVLDRALEKDREDRYQTVHEMLIDLRRLNKDSGRMWRQPHDPVPMHWTATEGPAVERKKGWRGRLWGGAAGAAALCVVSLLLLISRMPAARLNPNRNAVTLKVPFETIEYPSLSRDGNWIAFPAADVDGKYDIYWMNTAGGKLNRVTGESNHWMETVDISPDASQIVYGCVSKRNVVFKVKVVASQGGISRTLADTGCGPQWNPAGTRIAYVRMGAVPSVSGKLEIWSLKSDGTDNRLEFTDTVTTRPPTAFSWSPDGRSITWVRNFPEGHGEVIVRELATGRERQITYDRKRIDEVIWAGNDQILFVSDRSGLTSLWMISAGGGEATQVTQGGGVPIYGARISADSRILVYLQQEWLRHIWLSKLDGSSARRLTSHDVSVNGASFSPDGTQIAHISGEVDWMNPRAHLCLMDRDGKNERELTSGSDAIFDCRWSPDGERIAYSSRAPEESDTSRGVYLIEPFNPGPPRLLCRGSIFRWLDEESLLVFSGVKTLRFSIKGGMATQVYQDSTFAIPIQHGKRLLVNDFRSGREGWWTASVDSEGRQTGEARKIAPAGVTFGVPPDGRFLIYRKQGDNMYRVWTSTGREEPLGKALPGEVDIKDINKDGTEILWVKQDIRSKLVLVRNLFQ